MPYRYVSSLAPGGGAGTVASPYTLAELIAAANWAGGFNAAQIKADAPYLVAGPVNFDLGDGDLNGYATTVGDQTRATLRLTANLASASTYLVARYNGGRGVTTGLTLDLNGQAGSGLAVGNNGHYLYNLGVTGLTGTATGINAYGSHVVRCCNVTHNGTGTCVAGDRLWQACGRGGGRGIEIANWGATATACVAIGAATGVYYRHSGSAGPDWCLAINCTLGYDSEVGGTRYNRNFAVNCATATNGSDGTVRTLAASMFVAPNTGDLRLTASGKADPEVRLLMTRLYGTPGITTDSLADLLGGGRKYPVVGPIAGGVVG